jgi:general secretion pathway protein F
MYAQLAAMEKAGLPFDTAFSLLHLPGDMEKRVQEFRKMTTKGLDVPTAGLKSGLFTKLEATVLRAAFEAGSPTLSYKRLATRLDHQARQASLIKSRSIMPLLILLIALVVQPLPALVAGSMTMGSYVLFVIRPFIFLALLVFLYQFISARLSTPTNNPTSIQISFSNFVTRIPIFGTMLVRRNVRDFYENLALMLEAGIPMFDALPLAVETVSLSVIRIEFNQLRPKMEHGLTLAQAVSDLRYQTNSSIQSYAQTGEGSGNLSDMLFRFADGESEAIAQFQSQLATWLPRALYFSIALWMAYQILHTHLI